MITKPQLILLSGLPASGKTTRRKELLAEDPTVEYVNWDEDRLRLWGPDWVFNYKDENTMKHQSWERTKALLESGKSVVIDNTNLTSSVRNYWTNLGKHCGAEVIEEELDVPVLECVRLDRLREGNKRVGRAVIERMALFMGWVDWNDTSIYHQSASGKDFVIFDVDGTLADCSHRLKYVRPVHKMDCTYEYKQKAHPVGNPKGPNNTCPQCGAPLKKNWPAFFAGVTDDPLIQPVAKLLKILREHYYIIVVSGRPIDPCGIPTEDWLLKHDIDPLHLFMRGNDKRSDVEVKGEIADLLPLSRIAFVVDDRPAVVTGCWRKRGLTTLTVGDLKDF